MTLTVPSSEFASSCPDSTDGADLAIRLADMTAIAEVWQHQAENLTIALESNRQIGTAIGLVMAEHRLTHQAALGVLVRLSQFSNRKLRDLAADVVAVQETSYQTRRPGASPNPEEDLVAVALIEDAG